MTMFPGHPQPSARIGIVGLAFDGNSSWKQGAASAPPRIREAFFKPSSNLWTESGVDLGSPGIFTDVGDIVSTPGSMNADTLEAAGRLHGEGFKVIALGGDHSVSTPLVHAASERHGLLSIIHFDAHPDLYDNFEGNPESHASPFARIMENGWACRLVQVGIRTMNRHQQDQARRFNVEVFGPDDLEAFQRLVFDGPVYISLDMDCLDPSCAPGVSHQEPGGCTTREIVRIIKKLHANVVAADIVEYNPAEDLNGMTAMVAAKFFKEISAKMLEYEI
jgi:arginase